MRRSFWKAHVYFSILIGNVVEVTVFPVVGVFSAATEISAKSLLQLHDNKGYRHTAHHDTPLHPGHGTHLEDDIVETGDVGDSYLQDGGDEDSVPGILVTSEDARMKRAVVAETGADGDGGRSHSELVVGLGADFHPPVLFFLIHEMFESP